MSDIKGHWEVELVEETNEHVDAITLTVEQWIAMCVKTDDEMNLAGAWSQFLGAYLEVTKHRLWEARLRHEPRVAYDIETDNYLFLFRVENNSSLFTARLELG